MLPHNNMIGPTTITDKRLLNKNMIAKETNKPNIVADICIPRSGLKGIINSPMNIRAIRIPAI